MVLLLSSTASRRNWLAFDPPILVGGINKTILLLQPSSVHLRAEARPPGRAVSMERLGDWDGRARRLASSLPPCARQACHKTKRRVGTHCSLPYLGRECSEAGLPDKALHIPTSSHLSIVYTVNSPPPPPAPTSCSRDHSPPCSSRLGFTVYGLG